MLRTLLRILLIGSFLIMLFMMGLALIANARGWMDFRRPDAEIMARLDHAGRQSLPRMDTLETDSWSICYAAMERPRVNTRTAIFFLHGTPGSLDNFLGYLADTSLQAMADLYVPDRPGFGQSNFGKAMPGLADQASALKNLVDRVGAEKNIFVGHSLGCSIIARFAMDYPTHTDGLMMIAAPIDPALEPPNWWRKIMAWRIFKPFIPKAFWVSNEELVILEDELEAMLDRWDAILAPTLIIHGDEDMLVPVENVDFGLRMMTACPDLKADILEGQGHFILWSHQARLSRSIRDLVSRASAQ